MRKVLKRKSISRQHYWVSKCKGMFPTYISRKVKFLDSGIVQFSAVNPKTGNRELLIGGMYLNFTAEWSE